MGETKWIKEENFGVWLQSVDVICIAIPAAKLLVEVLKQFATTSASWCCLIML